MKMVALYGKKGVPYQCPILWIRIAAKVKSAMDRRKEIEMIKSPPYLFMLSSVITELSDFDKKFQFSVGACGRLCDWSDFLWPDLKQQRCRRDHIGHALESSDNLADKTIVFCRDPLCCDLLCCPMSVHCDCVALDDEPEGSYFCPDCTSDKSVLFGDIVWVKMGQYRYDIHIEIRFIEIDFLPICFQMVAW